MKFVTVVNNAAFSNGGISKFAFTAVKDIYDSDVIRESRGYKKLIVELNLIDKAGVMKCLRIADGKVRITVGSAYGPELAIKKDHLLAIMVSTIDLNNLILNTDHVMRGDSIFEFNSEYTYVLTDYLQLMVNIIQRSAVDAR